MCRDEVSKDTCSAKLPINLVSKKLDFFTEVSDKTVVQQPTYEDRTKHISRHVHVEVVLVSPRVSSREESERVW